MINAWMVNFINILMVLLWTAKNSATAFGFSLFFSSATLSIEVMGNSPESVLSSKVSVDDRTLSPSSRTSSTLFAV